MNKRKSLVGLVALVLVMSLLTVSTIEAKKAPKLSNKKITLKVGQKKKLKVKNAKKVTWKSSNKKIATVSKKGVVTAKKAGKVTISAKVGKKVLKCKVTVKKKPTPKPIKPTPTKPEPTKPTPTTPVQQPTTKPEEPTKEPETTKKDEQEETTDNINRTKPYFSVANVDTKAGAKSVKVAVNINNNPGILGMSFAIKYDESVMKLKDVQEGEATKGVLSFTPGGVLESGCRFIYDGTEINSSQIKDGNIMILTFDVSDRAPKGKHLIEISYGENDSIVDNNLMSLDVQILNGCINVK